MKYITQFFIILVFSLVGELLQAWIPLPIPAAIYGLVLLLIALCSGLLKPTHIAQTAQFLIHIMPVLFVAPAANLLANWGLIAPQLVPICVITLVSTLLVFAVAGLVTKWLRRKGDDHCG